MSREMREIFQFAAGPMFRGMSVCAQGLYIRAIGVMREMGQCDLRTGSLPADADWLSRTLGVSERELEHFDRLVLAGALERDEAGYLSSPLLRQQQERRARQAEARREVRVEIDRRNAEADAAGLPRPNLSARHLANITNGRLGGRPSSRTKGQRELLGPQLIASEGNPVGFSGNPDGNPLGFGEPADENGGFSPASRGLSVCLDSEDPLNQTDRQAESRPRAETQEPTENPIGKTHANPASKTHELDTVERVGREVLAIASLDQASWGENSRPIVEAWFAMGLSDGDVISEAKRLVAASSGRIRKLGWFNSGFDAIVKARGHVRAASAVPTAVRVDGDAQRKLDLARQAWEALPPAEKMKTRLPRLQDFSAGYEERMVG